MSEANDIYAQYDKQQRTAFVSEETYRHEVELHQAAIVENAALRKELEQTRAMAQADVQDLQDKLQKTETDARAAVSLMETVGHLQEGQVLEPSDQIIARELIAKYLDGAK